MASLAEASIVCLPAGAEVALPAAAASTISADKYAGSGNNDYYLDINPYSL